MVPRFGRCRVGEVTERVVVVGGSLAGLRAAEELRELGFDGEVTVVGAETHLPYDRPPLSKQILTGKAEPGQIAFPVEDGTGIEWVLGTTASGLDLERRRVILDGGDDLGFDRLVIATGAQPRILPVAPPGPGVHYLRTIDDAVALRSDLIDADHLAVIGAGFIGLEVAASAASIGVEVTVLEVLPVPLERAIGAEMGHAVAGLHQRRGMDLRFGVGVDGIEGRERPEGVRLTDGSTVAADVVVVGVGVAPAADWLVGSGVEVSDGVLCDERLRVIVEGRPRPDVVAAGDVVRWLHPGYGERVRIEHWTNASEQGPAAAQTLLKGDEAPPYEPVPYFWSDQHGIKIQFVGRAGPEDEVQVLEGSPEDERFVAAYGRNGRLVGAIGMRRPARVMALQQQIAQQATFPPA
jgi:NADPH-dependent 2,4-dienoyl-CoA reductase/sulfur reductase-like enzyme